MAVRHLSELVVAQERLARPPEHARRNVVEVGIGDHALASENVGSGVRVGGKEVVRVSAERGREGGLAVPEHGGEEVRAVGSVGCVELSKPPGSPHNSQGAEENERVRNRRVVRLSVVWDQYRLFFDTVAYTLYHALYSAEVISCWLVISEPHHPPTFDNGVPVHLNDPILELFPRRFNPTKSHGRYQVSPGQRRSFGGFTYRSHSSSVTCITS